MAGGQDVFLGVARASPPPPPPPPSCSPLLGSTTSSDGPQMLSFSSNGASGLGLSSGASSMQGVLARVRGPFTPTQWMELEHQALIYKHFAVNAPVPSSLLLPIRRSIYPWSTFGSSSLAWAPYRPGCADAEPGRCRRTDGKKWRCSRDAVGDQKYCERHLNRGRHRSRKHVEGQKATPTISGPAMAVSGGVSSRSHSVAWQQQVKSSAANATDPFSREPNRKLLDKQNIHGQFSVSTSMDSFDFSSSRSSLNHDKVALSPVELQHDHDQAYIVQGAGSSAENSNKLQESRLLVSRETIDDGPLGEVFKSKNCQIASGDTLTDERTASRKSHSPTGILQMTSKFSSVSSSNTMPAENHISRNGSLTMRLLNSQTVTKALVQADLVGTTNN
ncbi:growth-regulating factor 8-like [Phragmites australis]|uniref:growth-regulating factor 8-like n=1 Tax=Phragmites australis TaxID=29695 RepID=UPI002D79C006|nr:growth-regulating factor 8-like [Phragmites australis]